MTEPRKNSLLTIVTNPQSADPLELALVVDGPVIRGQPIRARLAATGGTGGYVYALGDGTSLPTGCTGPDGTTGEIAGTPTVIGHYEFTATVQDSSSTSLPPETFAIDVVTSLTGRDVAPVIGEIGVPYSYQLRVNGATGAVTWTVASGDLPPGLALSLTGLISGTPTEPHGISYVTVHAVDAGSGDPFDAEIAVSIASPLATVFPSPQLDVMARVPTTIDLTPMFKDGVPPYTATPLGGIPDGMQVDKIDGKDSDRWGIIGTPMVTPPHAEDENRLVGVTIRDALGATTDIALQVMIRNPVNSLTVGLSGSFDAPATPRLDLHGSAIKSMTSDPDTGTAVDITPQAAALSVLANPGITAGDAVSIPATANNRVLARVGDTITWVQISPAMMDGPLPIANGGTGATTAANARAALGAGTVLNVGATSPLTSTGGTSPVIAHGTSGITAGTYDSVTFNATGHAIDGRLRGTTVFTRAVAASLQYNASDFASMTTSTDVVRLTGSGGGTSVLNEFFLGARAGQIVHMVNASNTTMTIKNNSAGGTAGSKYLIGADFTLLPDHGVTWWRDGASSAWRLVGAY